MSAFVLKKEYALQLPNSYIEIDSDEMEYVDGGALNNHWWNSDWFISNAINTVITLIIGGAIGIASGYLRKQAAAYGAKAAAVMFSSSLKKKLTAIGVSYAIASGVASFCNVAFNILMWASNPGGALFNYVDARDVRPNNGHLNI